MTDTAPQILVIDDELSMRELLEYMLSKEGYSVTCAQNGSEAISLLKKSDFQQKIRKEPRFEQYFFIPPRKIFPKIRMDGGVGRAMNLMLRDDRRDIPRR